MSKQCLFCNADFKPTNNRQAYCGTKCWWQAVGKIDRQQTRKVFKRKCKECGNAYETTDKRKVYCSESCKITYNNTHRLTPHKGKKGECAVCGKEFTVSRNPTKITCSPKCVRLFVKYDGNRLKALRRDNFTCQLCGKSKGQQFEVHHIDCTGQQKAPNHNLDNLVTLCVKCHKTLHAGMKATGKTVTFEVKT